MQVVIGGIHAIAGIFSVTDVDMKRGGLRPLMLPTACSHPCVLSEREQHLDTVNILGTDAYQIFRTAT